jgi:hypothetical protein
MAPRSPAIDAQNKRIIFAPASGHATLSADQRVTIQFFGLRVNRQVGSAPLPIEVEWRAPETSSWKKVNNVEAASGNQIWASADLAVTPGRALKTNNIQGTDTRNLTISHEKLVVNARPRPSRTSSSPTARH